MAGLSLEEVLRDLGGNEGAALQALTDGERLFAEDPGFLGAVAEKALLPNGCPRVTQKAQGIVRWAARAMPEEMAEALIRKLGQDLHQVTIAVFRALGALGKKPSLCATAILETPVTPATQGDAVCALLLILQHAEQDSAAVTELARFPFDRVRVFLLRHSGSAPEKATRALAVLKRLDLKHGCY